MAKPTSYKRGFSFTNHQQDVPDQPLPGIRVDIELDNIARSSQQLTDFVNGQVAIGLNSDDVSIVADEIDKIIYVADNMPEIREANEYGPDISRAVDLFLGAFTADPALGHGGEPLTLGATYYNTVVGESRVWNGESWVPIAKVSTGGVLQGSFVVSGGATEFTIGDYVSITVSRNGDTLRPGYDFYPTSPTIEVPGAEDGDVITYFGLLKGSVLDASVFVRQQFLTEAGERTYTFNSEGVPLNLTQTNHVLFGGSPFGPLTYGVDYEVVDGAAVLAFDPEDGELYHVHSLPRFTNSEAQVLLQDYKDTVAAEADRAEAAAGALEGIAFSTTFAFDTVAGETWYRLAYDPGPQALLVTLDRQVLEFGADYEITEEGGYNGLNFLVPILGGERATYRVSRTEFDGFEEATPEATGLMSAADKAKLDGVATGANNYSHPTSGVTAGDYGKVTVNAQGHVTGGTNPTTLAGYGIADAAPLAHVGAGGAAHAAATTSAAGFMAAADKTKLDGVAAGANNYVHPTSGVAAGSYGKVTVNAAGHVTAGENPTTLAGHGITDAAPSSHVGSGGAAHAVATTSAAGFMSPGDKLKLNGIPEGGGGGGGGDYVHPPSGVTPGTYTKVSVDINGHVSTGENPTTLAGYGIADAAPSSHVGSGGTAHAAATTSAAGFMAAADKTKLDGVAEGANNYSHPTSGVTAGAYGKVTVNAQGHVTAGENPTTLAGHGITDAAPSSHVGAGGAAHAAATTSAAGFMAAADKVKLNGVAAGANNYVHPNSVVSAGSYGKVTVDAQGHVTAGENPTTLAGHGITDATPSSHVGSGGAAHALATTSLAGFLSSADKLKLDGLTKVASSTDTVVGRLLTTGYQGLGHAAIGYATGTSWADNTGTQFIAGPVGTNAPVDKPINNRAFTGVHIAASATRWMELVADQNPTDLGRLYARGGDSGTIAPWRKVLDDTDFNSTAALATTTNNGFMAAADKTLLNGIPATVTEANLLAQNAHYAAAEQSGNLSYVDLERNTFKSWGYSTVVDAPAGHPLGRTKALKVTAASAYSNYRSYKYRNARTTFRVRGYVKNESGAASRMAIIWRNATGVPTYPYVVLSTGESTDWERFDVAFEVDLKDCRDIHPALTTALTSGVPEVWYTDLELEVYPTSRVYTREKPTDPLPVKPANFDQPDALFNNGSNAGGMAPQTHLGRRAFVGNAHGFNGNNAEASGGGSWLGSHDGGKALRYFEVHATFLSASNTGGIGGTFAARQLDPAGSAPIGLAFASDLDCGAGKEGWSLYGEGIRSKAAAGNMGFEYDAINRVPNGGLGMGPYMPLANTSPVNYGLALASGGDRQNPKVDGAPVYDVDQALEFRNNGARWRAGLVSRNDALVDYAIDGAPSMKHTIMTAAKEGWSVQSANQVMETQCYFADNYVPTTYRKLRTADVGASFAAYMAFGVGTVGSIYYNKSTGATSYNTTSDVRVKENIRPSDDAGGIIDAIQVRAFDMKNGGRQAFGFVAQELNEVFSEAVTPGDDDWESNGEVEAIWSVDPSKLVPLLVKEIQDLRRRMAAAEQKED